MVAIMKDFKLTTESWGGLVIFVEYVVLRMAGRLLRHTSLIFIANNRGFLHQYKLAIPKT